MGDKGSGWLDHTRRARRNEDRAFVQSAEDAIQLERHLAEPADVRAISTAAQASFAEKETKHAGSDHRILHRQL
jgi:transposase-like protein